MPLHDVGLMRLTPSLLSACFAATALVATGASVPAHALALQATEATQAPTPASGSALQPFLATYEAWYGGKPAGNATMEVVRDDAAARWRIDLGIRGNRGLAGIAGALRDWRVGLPMIVDDRDVELALAPDLDVLDVRIGLVVAPPVRVDRRDVQVALVRLLHDAERAPIPTRVRADLAELVLGEQLEGEALQRVGDVLERAVGLAPGAGAGPRPQRWLERSTTLG